MWRGYDQDIWAKVADKSTGGHILATLKPQAVPPCTADHSQATCELEKPYSALALALTPLQHWDFEALSAWDFETVTCWQTCLEKEKAHCRIKNLRKKNSLRHRNMYLMITLVYYSATKCIYYDAVATVGCFSLNACPP